MQTRRDFIKGIAALVASVPVIGLAAKQAIGFDITTEYGDMLIDNRRIPLDHIQPVNISTELGREPVWELGRKKPYHDIYLSKEALEDIRNWGVDQIDEQIRREIYQSDQPSRLFGISIGDYSK